MATTTDEQLAIYLTDAHAIELQALVQVKRAPEMAVDPQLAEAFRKHIEETERHERFVRGRLEALSWAPVTHKDLAGKATGIGFALFARFQPDTPGKLAAHAFSYEHMELATYELLARVAERAGDQATADVARRIRAEEEAMSRRIADSWEGAVTASLAAKGDDDLDARLNKYLADAHAIESQAIQLLQRG